jgi:hypothetical protein
MKTLKLAKPICCSQLDTCQTEYANALHALQLKTPNSIKLFNDYATKYATNTCGGDNGVMLQTLASAKPSCCVDANYTCSTKYENAHKAVINQDSNASELVQSFINFFAGMDCTYTMEGGCV